MSTGTGTHAERLPGRRRVRILMGWMTCCVMIACVGACFCSMEWLILRWHYPAEQIRRENLHIVDHKPTVVVSNGDDIGGAPFPQTILFPWVMIGGMLALVTAFHFALPRACRALGEERSTPDDDEPLPDRLLVTAILSSAVLLVLSVCARTWVGPLLSIAMAIGLLGVIRRTCATSGDDAPISTPAAVR